MWVLQIKVWVEHIIKWYGRQKSRGHSSAIPGNSPFHLSHTLIIPTPNPHTSQDTTTPTTTQPNNRHRDIRDWFTSRLSKSRHDSSTPPDQIRQLESISDQHSSIWGCTLDNTNNNCIRFVFQNSNGAPCNSGDFEMLKEILSEYQVGTFGLAETQKNWSNAQVRTRFESSLGSEYSSIKLAFASSSERTTTSRQMGGVCMGSLPRMASHLESQGNDHSGMGRWCY